ncbi:DNA repair protein RecO [Lapidilactobacillus dextrinicus]|jgi:DNA repair protein RecO (recombination protein O)|uniref:DNA repair protein RecO n=1 Tax=Lapidilactobacillus dextrinicus TaxID=51664 RepID=UPI0022E18AE8|nr:DNA repair protein RecO [Lapidilactobacillus dextrinicus]
MALFRDTEFRGIVMYRRDYRERDLLVQILTDKYAAKMFMVRGAKKQGFKLQTAILPLTFADYIGAINTQGLSYISATKSTNLYTTISADIVLQAYAAYLLTLVAAAFDEGKPLGQYFDLVKTALDKMNGGTDPQLLTNLVEIKLLNQFGVAPHLQDCVICQRTDLPMDYSEQYGGLLCQNHWHQDQHRLHAQPKTIALMQGLARIMPQQLGTINLSVRTKKDLQRILDKIYQDQVGLQLKSKKYLDEMLRMPQLTPKKVDKSPEND